MHQQNRIFKDVLANSMSKYLAESGAFGEERQFYAFLIWNHGKWETVLTECEDKAIEFFMNSVTAGCIVFPPIVKSVRSKNGWNEIFLKEKIEEIRQQLIEKYSESLRNEFQKYLEQNPNAFSPKTFRITLLDTPVEILSVEESFRAQYGFFIFSETEMKPYTNGNLWNCIENWQQCVWEGKIVTSITGMEHISMQVPPSQCKKAFEKALGVFNYVNYAEDVHQRKTMLSADNWGICEENVLEKYLLHCSYGIIEI